MEDVQIVELYHKRDERAIGESDRKYGRYCSFIAFHILNSNEDASECVNDTWLRSWNVMPPERPAMLKTFFGKITRNLSIDRARKNDALKRGGGETVLAIDELNGCVPSTGDFAESLVEGAVLKEVMGRFLKSLPERQRRVFVRRYWYIMSVAEIADIEGMSASNVKTTLSRCRDKLKAMLSEEGIGL